MDSDAPDMDYPDLPPFPADVPTAPLLRLRLQKLIDKDPLELTRLWKACTELGFFYLDLRGARKWAVSSGDESRTSSFAINGIQHGHDDGHEDAADDANCSINGDAYIDEATRLFAIQDEFFSLPVEEKRKYDLIDEGSYFGYKARLVIIPDKGVTLTLHSLTQGYGSGLVDAKGTPDRNEFYNVFSTRRPLSARQAA